MLKLVKPHHHDRLPTGDLFGRNYEQPPQDFNVMSVISNMRPESIYIFCIIYIPCRFLTQKGPIFVGMLGFNAAFNMVLQPVDTLSGGEDQEPDKPSSTTKAKAKGKAAVKPKAKANMSPKKRPATKDPKQVTPTTPKKTPEAPSSSTPMKRPAAGPTKRPAMNTEANTEATKKAKIGMGYYKRDGVFGFKVDGKECLKVSSFNLCNVSI